MKEEYYIPNTSGEKISFDGKEYIFAEDLHDEISPPQNPDDPAERLLELYYAPILVCDDPLFDYKTAEIIGIIETETD